MQPNDTHSQCNTYCLHLDCSKQDNNGEMKMVAIEYFISYFVMNPSQLHFVQILRYTHPTIVNVLVTLVHWVSKFKGDQDHVAPPSYNPHHHHKT